MTPQDGAPDTRFPAWAIDTVIASAVASSLLTAMSAAVSPAVLVKAFTIWARRTFGALKPSRVQAYTWLTAVERAHPRIAPVIGAAFADAYAGGWAAGAESADVLLGRTEAVGIWHFKPGDPEDARRWLAGRRDKGAERLWRDSAPFMRRAVSHRIAELARALTDDTMPQAMEASVRAVIGNDKWARKVAQTEVSRAVSAATLAGYRRDRVPAKEWMNAFDQRVCEQCRANEAAGPIGLGEEFPSGQLHPPGHPECRCGLLPRYRDRQHAQ